MKIEKTEGLTPSSAILEYEDRIDDMILDMPKLESMALKDVLPILDKQHVKEFKKIHQVASDINKKLLTMKKDLLVLEKKVLIK